MVVLEYNEFMTTVQIVGVLNVTPDSFHDGGKFTTLDAARAQAETMLSEGADIIEIGGQSSLNTEFLAVEEEALRVLPVLTALRKKFPTARLSVDTMRSDIAEEAISAGAMMINDVSAGRRDPQMLSVVATCGVPLVLMYSKDIPPTSIGDRDYDDVVAHIKDFLSERIEAALAAGVSREKIIIDPGLGFFISNNPQYSFQILSHLEEFVALGFPIFLSPSRKSFLAGPQKLPSSERLPATIAASAIAVMKGATYIRTHDVKEVKRGCEVALSVIHST